MVLIDFVEDSHLYFPRYYDEKCMFSIFLELLCQWGLIDYFFIFDIILKYALQEKKH